ncbi:glycosyltransferase family 2 protein [Curtobacterium sp. PhB146]|uniref:glycosyltransferase family 2 protein n=1 Tax=Curtobacterium sp. PhB146 TaxID=2485187 RepID=UPI001047AE5C|nr:glycosyltransferase family 2 protein [Curtobacterium sp. PhB146]TCU44468.1 glycosyltransferase involved in cell wall biosynthesis [Curtobacterium sp. PhB146]
MNSSRRSSGLLPISVIVLAKNEEAQIGETLASLDRFAEVTVVDSNSEDRTAEIAVTHGARVLQFSWDGQYPKKKQWSLEHVKTDLQWILLLDADETPTEELYSDLNQVLQADSGSYSAYDLPLRYRFAGTVLRHGHKVTKRSLLRAGKCHFPDVGDELVPGIREVEGHYQPEVDGNTGRLSGAILHNDQDPVSSWFDRHNRYSDWEAHLRLKRDVRTAVAQRRTRQGQLFDRVPFKPAAFFLYSYLFRAGFLDGRAGFDYAFALSAYYWQIGVKTRELQRSGLDIH